MNWDKYMWYIRAIAPRYYIIAGIIFLLFYVVLKKSPYTRKIQPQFPKRRDYIREQTYSITSIMILALVSYSIWNTPQLARLTKSYRHIETHGWVYFFMAFPLMLIIHDTYFYWTHRLVHHRIFFSWMHKVHHQSHNPTPWTAYAMHPLEAFMQSGIFLLFEFILPMHSLHIFIFFLWLLLYNIYGHLGYELFPKKFNRHWLGKWIVTSVAHNQHHEFSQGNYGLYFTVWDRLMHTFRADYDEKFEAVTEKRSALQPTDDRQLRKA